MNFTKQERIEINSLINTSVNDCRSSLAHKTDITLLKKVLAVAGCLGHKSRAKVIQRRINELQKAETEVAS